MDARKDDLEAELKERVRFETLLADLSARFVGVRSEELDREIEEAQRQICETLGFDQSTIGQPDRNGVPHLTHCWAAPGCTPFPRTIAAPIVPWATKEVLAGHIVRITSVAALPAEAAIDAETMAHFGTKSGLCLPLVAGGKAMGVLTFGIVRCEREWPDGVVKRLQLVADVFAGAFARRVSEEALRDALAATEALKEQLQAENVTLRRDLQSLDHHDQILGRSAGLRHVLAQVEQVAATDASVLLQGETGTGKGLVACAIHRLSARGGRHMVQVNCAAVPSTLIESELFGREKGAYTGALSRQAGRFEAAHGSSLFLDEIGELPLEVQAKLLRVLDDGQLERLGSSTPIHVNVRVIAATNLDLEKAVREGRFRQDLYYRLNVFPISVPPLRDRQEDIPLLVTTFAYQYAKAMGKTFTTISQSNLEALQRYPWPGNVRELRNAVERAVILARGPKLSVDVPSLHPSGAIGDRTMRGVERAHILHVLEQTGWRVQGRGGAAEILGLRRTTLESRMARLGIHRPKPH